MNTKRRRLLLAVCGTAVVGAGCAAKPMRPTSADGSYCYQTGKRYRPARTCTTGPVPSDQADAMAKRFEPSGQLLTVYLVRKRWADSRHVVRVTASGGTAVDTVPDSFVRWRLPPGGHELTASWSDGQSNLDIAGAAGEVVFVELVGAAWSWGGRYRLEQGDPDDSRQRATRSRLVADVG
jgi:hypothetical protein